MNTQLLQLYKKFRKHSPFTLVGSNAALALRSARTLARFRELEALDLVRMREEPEDESPFDVFGEPEGYKNNHGHWISPEQERKELCEIYNRLGVWWIASEYRDEHGEWQHADSCGMFTGYANALNPFENGMVIDEMTEAVKQAEQVMREPELKHDAACRDIVTV